MTKKSKLYTKGGDRGETSLVSGTRISKNDLRIDVYGEIDHLNSFIGLLKVKLESELLKKQLHSIQKSLFDLGSLLSCEIEFWEKYSLPRIVESDVEKLEEYIDEMDASIPALKNFILPGGSETSALFHICRTICRKSERMLVGFDKNIEHETFLRYLNRLSDYFFVASRFVNSKMGIAEDLWGPNV